ncbi:MAG: energy-coupling factor ABC transporter ATP-binding protein [Clostridiales bacterium]|nr:energy-coupling factor ABC transporter ATP-binding protein [Clostridiales bacterium]
MKKILVEHLKYRYPQAAELALNDISFEAEEGEKIGVIGRNGAGKSTLCQALTGLVPHFYKGAYGGRVIVDGTEVLSSSISEIVLKVGIVFQNPFTQVTGAKETVYDEVAFGLENLGLPRGEISSRVDAALELLRIYRFKDQAPFSLSGGQTQRMAIAGIIAMRPRIIVLDEPTSQLDPQGSEEVYQALDDLSDQGLTIVLTEHKIEKIAQYCDKILVLQDGRSVAFDTPARLFSAEDSDAWGIRPPVYTSVCRKLLRPPTGVYPVTLSEAGEALANWEAST